MACMAVLVVFCTVYALVMPAVALNGKTYCGKTEHAHDKSCYESVLTCGKEEGEDGHVHDDSCYEEQLVCEKEEHTHEDACYVNPDAEEETDAKAEADTESVKATDADADETSDSTKEDAASEEDSEKATTEAEAEDEDVSSEGTTEDAASEEDSEKATTEAAAKGEDASSEEMTEDAEKQTEETDTEKASETTEEDTDTENEQSKVKAAALPDGANVPEGYTEQYTVRNDESGYAVTVYAPEGTVPQGAELKAELLDENDTAYNEAKEALDAQNDAKTEATETDEQTESAEPETAAPDFAALDIHFEDADGKETEPDGNVYVVIDADRLLPADADPASVTVQHHEEKQGGEVTVETVADTADATSGVVATQITGENSSGNVQAAFGVNSFSTFTISWLHDDYNDSLTVQRINEDGTGIGDDFVVEGSDNSVLRVSEIANAHPVEGYTFARAVIADSAEEAWNSETNVQRIRNNESSSSWGGGTITRTWQYSSSENGSNWRSLNNATIFFLYKAVGGLTIDDSSLLSDGRLIPKYASAAEGDVLEYVWERKEEGSNQWTTVSRQAVTEVNGENLYNVAEDGSWLNVTLDEGARTTYRVKLVSVNGAAVSDEIISPEYKVPYYDALQNGSFETPAGGGNEHFVGSGTEAVVWKTTGEDSSHGSRIELVGDNTYAWHGVNYCPTDDVYTESVQCAELNADSEGALYQDVLTSPGSTMYWSLMHNGRTRNNTNLGSNASQNNPASDTMYVLIMSTDLAMNSNSNQINGEIDTQDEVDYVMNHLDEFPGASVTEITYQWYWTNSWGSSTLHVRSGQGGVYTEWSSYSPGKDGEVQTVWANHQGSYAVPSDQYLTRYFFVAGDTELGRNVTTGSAYSVGNHIDNVYFSTTVPPAADGTATLTIQKNISGLTSEDYENLKDKLKFNIKYGSTADTLSANETGWSWNGTVDETTGKGNWTGTYVISGINVPANGSVSYTVEENDDTADVEGYTLEASATDSSNLTVTGTLNDGETDTVKYTNAYTSTTADLTIIKNIYGLDEDEVEKLIDGTYRQLNPGTADESGLRFDVDVFEKEEYLKNDENGVDVPEGWPGNFWNIRDWTFDVSDTLDNAGFSDAGTWGSQVTEVGDASIGIGEGEHYQDISFKEMNDGGETYYQYKVTIKNVDVSKWYRVWELHMDVPGHVLTASVDTQGATTIFNGEQNHGGRASAFQLTRDTTVTFTNRYEQGDLEITKVLSGLENQADSNEEFIFTVSIPAEWAMSSEYNDGKYKITYERPGSTMKHEDGTVTFSSTGETNLATAEIRLCPGETAIITLPIGIAATVTESNEDGDYRVSWSGEGTGDNTSFTTSTITKGNPVEVTCTNTSAAVDVIVKKVDSLTEDALNGAEFLLYYEKDEQKYYYSETTSGGTVTVNWDTEIPDNKLTSDTDGIFNLYDLKDGTYYLAENKAPDGYTLLDSPVTITISNGQVSATYGGNNLFDKDTNTITVPNTTGQELPETGGAGTTTLITISGLLLMAAAVGGGYGLRRKREERY